MYESGPHSPKNDEISSVSNAHFYNMDVIRQFSIKYDIANSNPSNFFFTGLVFF